jgi:membrane-associated protein
LVTQGFSLLCLQRRGFFWDFFCQETACSLLLVFWQGWGCLISGFLWYEFGKRVGPRIFAREDSFLFKKDHALKAQKFYEKHGAKTLFLARFMPIVRTFAPIVAGVAKMEYRSFLFYSSTGATAWVVGLVLAGYYLGGLPIVREYLEVVILGIIFVSVLPAIVEYWKEKRLQK